MSDSFADLPGEMLQEITSHLVTNPTAMSCWRAVGRRFRDTARHAPWTADWVHFFPGTAVLEGERFHIPVPRRIRADTLTGRMALRIIYQAAADDNPGILKQFQLCFTGVDHQRHRAGQVTLEQEVELVTHLKYLSAMHGATDTWLWLKELRESTGDDGLKNYQCLYLALGCGHRAWAKENLPIEMTANLDKQVIQYGRFVAAQGRLRFRCEDPLLVWARRDQWVSIRRVLAVYKQDPAQPASFLTRYNSICLAWGREVEWISQLRDYDFQNEHFEGIARFILSQGCSTRGLDLLVTKYGMLPLVIYLNAIGALVHRPYPMVCLFMDWFLAKGVVAVPLASDVAYIQAWSDSKTLT